MAPSPRRPRAEKRLEEDSYHVRGRARSPTPPTHRLRSSERHHPRRPQSPSRGTRRSRSPPRRQKEDIITRRRRSLTPQASTQDRRRSPIHAQRPGSRTRSPTRDLERSTRREAKAGNRRTPPGPPSHTSRRQDRDRHRTPLPEHSRPGQANRRSQSPPHRRGEKRTTPDVRPDLLPDKRRKLSGPDHKASRNDRRREARTRRSPPLSEFPHRDKDSKTRHHRSRSPQRPYSRQSDRREPPSPRRGRSPRGRDPRRGQSPPRKHLNRIPRSPNRRSDRGASRDQSPRRSRRTHSRDMYPHSSGGYFSQPHARGFKPSPIDTRSDYSVPYDPSQPVPQTGQHSSRGGQQSPDYPPSHSWPSHHSSAHPPYPVDTRSHHPSRTGPSPSHSHPQQSPYSAHPSPSPSSARAQFAFNSQGSPPAHQSHASPQGFHPQHTSQSHRGGSHTPSRGGFTPQPRKDSQSSASTPAGSRSSSSTRGGAHFSNLTWKPGVGVRGGQAPTALFQTQQKQAAAKAAENSGASTSADADKGGVKDSGDRSTDAARRADGAASGKVVKPEADAKAPAGPSRLAVNGQKSGSANGSKDAVASTDPQAGDGPKISFNLKKPSGPSASAPRRDLLQTKVAPAQPATARQQSPDVKPARDDRRSLYSIRDTRDSRDEWDRDRNRDRNRRDDRSDYRNGPGRERDRDRYGNSRYDRPPPEKLAKPAPSKPKPPPPSLPDLLSTGKKARYDPAPPVIPVSLSAKTPVWLIRQMFDGVRQNHRKRLKLPPAEWLKENPNTVSLPAEHKSAKSQYPKQEDSVVGAGTYGQVYKTINVYKPNQGAVALKRVAMASESQNNGFPFTSVRELGALVAIKDLRIPKYFESMVERVVGNTADKVDLWYYMVFEYVPYDLAGIINHPTIKLELAHRKELAKQMYDGLIWLHSAGILHRDIKAGNILVDHNCVLKLTDFGLAKRYDLATGPKANHTNRIVTIWYRCPELLLGDNYYGTEPDFWAAACVLGEILLENGQALFPGPGTDVMQLDYMWTVLGKPTREEWPDMMKKPWYNLLLLDDQYSRKIRDSGGATKRYTRKFEERYRDKFTPAAMELLQWALQWDPAKRPDGQQILAHEFFTTEEPAAQRFENLGDALGGDFHEFDYKKHRDAARAERNAAQKAERDQRRKDEATARQEKLKRGADGDAGAESQTASKKARKDVSGKASLTGTGADAVGTTLSQSAASTVQATNPLEADVSMEASLEPGAPRDPAEAMDVDNEDRPSA